MILGGRSRKDPPTPVLKKITLPGNDKKHAYVPIQPGEKSPMIMMPQQPGKGSQRIVMVRGPAPTGAAVAGQSILVPVNEVTGGKFLHAGTGSAGQPIFLNAGKSPGSILIPKSGKQQQPAMAIPGGSSSDKPMVIMQQPLQVGGTQRIMIPASKGSKGGSFVMVPVSSSSGQQNMRFIPSAQKHVTVMGPKGTTLTQQFISQKGIKPGMSLIPVSMAGQKGAQIVRIPDTPLSTSAYSKSMPLRLASHTPANSKRVYIPDSALGSLMKGSQLIPVSGMSAQAQKNARLLNSTNIDALHSGKVVFIPNQKYSKRADPRGMVVNNSPLLGNNKNIIIVGGPEGKSLRPEQLKANRIIKTITSSVNTRPQIVYQNVSINKPIKPKPVLETSDTFFKTPIEIKPLEEEEDGDLNDVLNALSGRGHVDLVPVNPQAPVAASIPAPVSPKDYGLKIDSVYSLLDDSTTASHSDSEMAKACPEEQPSKLGDKLEKGPKIDPILNILPINEDSSGIHKSESHVSVCLSEPLLPEDEPSQSGPSTHDHGNTMPSEKTILGEDQIHKDLVGKSKDEDPNLMRGDCLQVRLAQQAARQLQEQMRLDQESLSMVQTEWDDVEMAESENGDEANNDPDDIYGGDTTDASLPSDIEEAKQNSSTELQVDNEDKDIKQGNISDSNNKSRIGDDKSDTDSDKTLEDEDSKSIPENSQENEEKNETDHVDDVAQKALLAASLNGCEVADEDLNEMFDELISEYLTTPERPKPSVRVRGIDECKTLMEDSSQSLVSTTQQSNLNSLNTSLIPRTIHALENKMKPRTVTTAAGTITLIPVKVPVPGKPGQTAIKYIPMQVPKGSSSTGKAQIPEFVKIVQNSLSSKADAGKTESKMLLEKNMQPKQSSGAVSPPGQSLMVKGPDGRIQTIHLKGNGNGPQTLKVKGPDGKIQIIQLKGSPGGFSHASSSLQVGPGGQKIIRVRAPIGGQTIQGLGSTGAGQIVQLKSAPGMPPRYVRIIPSSQKSSIQTNTLSSTLGKSLLKMVMAPSNSSASTTQTPSTGLSNEDMAKAIMGATKNVFGKRPVSSGILPNLVNSNVTYVQNKPQLNRRGPIVGPKCAHLAAAQRLNIRSGPLDGLVSQISQEAVSVAFGEALKTKKKKKKKRRKLPETKKCHVLLRKLNMKVIKNNSCNLKRVKKGFLFEAISRQPRREAKRKAVEIDHTTDLPAPKKAKDNKGETVPQPETNAPAKSGPLMQSNMYKIMSQLPILKPALPVTPRPTLNQILGLPIGTSAKPLQVDNINPDKVKNDILSMVKTVQDLDFASLSKLPTSPASADSSSTPSTITLTLSCTSASSFTSPNLSSQSVCTTSTTSSRVLTAACSAPVLSPSVSQKMTMVTSPSRSLLSACQRVVVSNSHDLMPRMPTLQPAGTRVITPGQITVRMPMPTLQPAPRAVLGSGLNLRQSPQMVQRLPLPTIRPRPVASPPPIVIQPTGPIMQPVMEAVRQPMDIIRQPIASAGASSSQSGGVGPSPNKKYLLIKTSNGQFLVPVPVSKPGSGASGAAGPTSITPIAPSLLPSGPVPLQIRLPLNSNVTQPALATTAPITSPIVVMSNSTSTTSVIGSKEKPKNIGLLPGVIKDEPKDTGYNKYEIPIVADAVVKQEKVVPEVILPVEEEPEEEPRVPPSVCHKQRIEELKARLREHEEQLLQLKRKREDTKKILDSLDDVDEHSE